MKIRNPGAEELGIKDDYLHKVPFYPLQLKKTDLKPLEMRKKYETMIDEEFFSAVN